MRLFPLLVALACFPGLALAETIHHAADGFSITLPPGWQEIPKETLAQLTAEGRKAVPADKAPDFRYGYRAPAANGAFPPYVLIWPKRTGRVSERELNAVPKTDLAAVSGQVRALGGSMVKSFTVDSMAYDPATHILWSTTEANYPGSGPVRSLNGGVMTEEGILWVYGYAPSNLFEQVRPTLAGVIGSVQPTEALRYKPRMFDWLSEAQLDAVGRLAGIVTGALFVFWVWRRRSRRTA